MNEFDLSSLNRERPPYVTFKSEPKENKKLSQEKGRYIAEDVEYACITTPGSKDILFERLPQWWDKLAEQVQNGRCPSAWVSRWKEQHANWKKGQEMPPEGTPVRGWAVVTPAQQEMLIRANILTVEDLANASADALQQVGMGSVSLKVKAETWLKAASLNGRGKVTQEMAAVKRENEHLKSEVETLKAQVEKLTAMVKEPVNA